MAKRRCQICGAEWEENFDECWNCGMPLDPDEQLRFDKDARRRLRKKKKSVNRRVKPLSKLNRGVYIPLILGSAALLKIVFFGGFGARTILWDSVGLAMFVAAIIYIIRSLISGL